jgi:HK97 family phage prohead protease
MAPVPLYEDQGPRLLVRGYAATFDRAYAIEAGRLEVIAPGAFDLGGGPAPVLFAHAPTMRYAAAARLFQDDHGLGFEFELPRTWAGLQLADNIRRGNVRQASASFDAPGGLEQHVRAGVTTDVVTRARLHEISLASCAANPWTSCWLDCETAEDLGPELAKDRARWFVGRQRARLAAAKARRKPAAPASVLAVLAGGRPKGWLGPADLPSGWLARMRPR